MSINKIEPMLEPIIPADLQEVDLGEGHKPRYVLRVSNDQREELVEAIKASAWHNTNLFPQVLSWLGSKSTKSVDGALCTIRKFEQSRLISTAREQDIELIDEHSSDSVDDLTSNLSGETREKRNRVLARSDAAEFPDAIRTLLDSPSEAKVQSGLQLWSFWADGRRKVRDALAEQAVQFELEKAEMVRQYLQLLADQKVELELKYRQELNTFGAEVESLRRELECVADKKRPNLKDRLNQIKATIHRLTAESQSGAASQLADDDTTRYDNR